MPKHDVERTFTVALPGVSAPAQIRLIAVSQEAIGDGNRVVVNAFVLLPASEGALLPEIRFKYLLQVCGETLTDDWGLSRDHGPEYRSRHQKFATRRWKSAYAQAEAWARAEIQCLVEALVAREQALADAELDDDVR